MARECLLKTGAAEQNVQSPMELCPGGEELQAVARPQTAGGIWGVEGFFG